MRVHDRRYELDVPVGGGARAGRRHGRDVAERFKTRPAVEGRIDPIRQQMNGQDQRAAA